MTTVVLDRRNLLAEDLGEQVAAQHVHWNENDGERHEHRGGADARHLQPEGNSGGGAKRRCGDSGCVHAGRRTGYQAHAFDA